jgi:hypothetical protein
VFDKVPAVKGLNFVLFQSTDLVKIQKLTKLLNDLAVVLPIIALLCFGGAVALSRNRRRGLVRAATGLALSMAVILVVMAVARNQYLSGLSPNQSVAASQAVIDTVTAALRQAVRVILIAAAIVAIVALIAGNRRLRAWTAGGNRLEWMTNSPVHGFVVRHRKGLQWAVLALGLLVLVIWNNPTALVSVIVVLITLVVVGVVGLFAGRGSTPAMAGSEGSISNGSGTDGTGSAG